ncbi:MAG: hypothetical protein Q9167_007860 [Letrouitia subvulpina]
MAEAAGLDLGAVSLAGLFTICVEYLDYIDIAQNHGRDFELSMTKLILLKAKLNTWGRSLQVTNEGQENTVLRDHWKEEQENVGRCLVGIKTIFEEADKMESRYGLRPLPADADIISLSQGQASNAFVQIETVFRSKLLRRQEKLSILQKTRWAIRDKKRFDAMIAELAFLINGLVDLCERLQALELQQKLLRVEIQAITDADSIRLMEQASDQLQAIARSRTIERRSESTDNLGHTYIETIIKDRARVLNGNIGDQSGDDHMYRGTQVSDDAYAIQGNISNEAALKFFK